MRSRLSIASGSTVASRMRLRQRGHMIFGMVRSASVGWCIRDVSGRFNARLSSIEQLLNVRQRLTTGQAGVPPVNESALFVLEVAVFSRHRDRNLFAARAGGLGILGVVRARALRLA